MAFPNLYNLYSFTDLVGTITNPATNNTITLDGTGVGDINFAKATDHVSQEQSADGSIFVMKIPGQGGVITISVQQNSPINAQLMAWENYCSYDKNIKLFASGSAAFMTLKDNKLFDAMGVVPKKIPDQHYAALSGMITWELICATLTITGP